MPSLQEIARGKESKKFAEGKVEFTEECMDRDFLPNCYGASATVVYLVNVSPSSVKLASTSCPEILERLRR